MPRRFDFISPGVQLTEVDQSQVPATPPADGLLLIGRARKGPAMKVIQCRTLDDFIETFGLPMDGTREDDPWRNGQTAAPNYAAYAAQAYLAAGVGPVKFVRLLGLNYDTDATRVAGWSAGKNFGISTEDNKTAQGLLLFPSSSTEGGTVDAVLAAIFYTRGGGGFALQGNVTNDKYSGSPSSTNGVSKATVYSVGANAQFNLVFSGSGGTSNITASINFNPADSGKYIRKVLNTDPTKIYNNDQFGETDVRYFLGETFESEIQSRLPSANLTAAGGLVGMIVNLGTSATKLDDFNSELKYSVSNWFIGQRPAQKYLFRLHALDAGEEFQNNYYARISDITPGDAQKDAKFSLQIIKKGKTRHASDNSPNVVESFDNMSLNPQSENYVAKVIGDQNISWSTSNQKFSISGLYTNKSNFVRVEMATGVQGSDIPVGFLGPKKFVADFDMDGTQAQTAVNELGFITGKGNLPLVLGTSTLANYWGPASAGHFSQTGSIRWPRMLLSTGSSNNGSNYTKDDYFGMVHGDPNKPTWGADYADIARERANVSLKIDAQAAFSTSQFVFTLEDIVSSSAANTSDFFHHSGSYNNARGSTNLPNSIAKRYGLTGSSANAVINGIGIKRFNVGFFGGFDGVDVSYANPFSNARVGQSGGELYYPRYTVDQAINMIADQDNVRYELVSIPGLVHAATQDKLISKIEDRGDALAIIDIDGIYQPRYDVEAAENEASILTSVNTIENRLVDSSYAAAYYPNIFLADTLNGNGSILKAPPSVAGIGAIAQSERVSQPWFAPAGFNRGGLGRLGGSKGPVVMGTVEHLTKNNRDTLYDAHINPIARFPSTGDVVVFGQRTLQQEASALDRINVRRLMIYLKRQIGIIADTILFDQNVQATWNRFKFQAETILSQVQTELGITEYKLVLDNTTTTPDLVDRNILYAKIFVKPARAIEFIAVDFIITRSGVEF